MRKLLALLACAALAAWLTGCSSNTTTSPVVDPAGAQQAVADGNAALASGDYAAANGFYQTAFARDPNNIQARFGVAVTDLYLVQNDPEVSSIGDYLGTEVPLGASKMGSPHSQPMGKVAALLNGTGRSYTPISEGRALVRMLALATTDPPAISDIQRVIRTKVMPKLQHAEDHLNAIELASEFVFKLPPAVTGLPDTIEIDRSDILLLDSVVNGLQGWLGLVVAYNFDVPNNDFTHVNPESLLAEATDWATLHDGGGLQLAAARQNLILVKTRLDQAAASLAAETDDQSDDVVPSTWVESPQYQELANGVTQAATTLVEPVPMEVNDHAGQPFAFLLHVGRFFVPAIADLKTELPNHTFDEFGDPQLVMPLTLPDPTINGIFPDMTNERWQQLTGLGAPPALARR